MMLRNRAIPKSLHCSAFTPMQSIKLEKCSPTSDASLVEHLDEDNSGFTVSN